MSLGVEFGRPGVDGVPPMPEPKGYLKAFDPLTGEEAWVVQRATPYNGGVLATGWWHRLPRRQRGPIRRL